MKEAATYIGVLEILLLLVETVLDDGGSCKETLLQAAQGFVLDKNGSLFFEGLAVIVAAFLQNWQQDVSVLLLSVVFLIVFLAKLHLVARLRID